jgi:hypothetical protein
MTLSGLGLLGNDEYRIKQITKVTAKTPSLRECGPKS